MSGDQDLFPEIKSKIIIRLRETKLGTGIDVFDARDEALYGNGSLHWTTGVERDEIAGGLLWTGGFITGALAHDNDGGDYSRPELNATLPRDLTAAGFTDLSVFCGNGEALSPVAMFPAAYALQDLGYDVWVAE